MIHLIDKDAVLAEIEELSSAIKIQLDYKKGDAFWIAQKLLLERLKEKINSLEVKEVDLEKEYKDFLKCDDGRSMFETAKHFFELGLKASNPFTWKDIKEICVQSVLVEIDLGGLVSDERHYTEVLKRFKAQKGE